MLSEAEIDKALEKLEQEYRSDRDALLRMKRLVGREILSGPIETAAVPSPPPAPKLPIVKKDSPSAKKVVRTRSNREIVKTAIAKAGERFTVTELMSSAKLSGDGEAASLAPSVWSSTLSHLCKSGALEVVTQCVGNTPSVYKLVISEKELLAPVKRGRDQPSPLQDAVKKAISRMSAIVFERTQLFEFLSQEDPNFGERYKLDSVGAVLNRLANNEDGVRIIDRSPSGNTYEKIS